MLKTIKIFALILLMGSLAACGSDTVTPVSSADATVVIGEYSGQYTFSLFSGSATVKVSSPSKGEVKIELTGLAIGGLQFNGTVGAANNNLVPISVATQKVSTYNIGPKNGANPTGTYNTNTKDLTLEINIANLGDVKFTGKKK
jgi:hypothetical protein